MIRVAPIGERFERVGMAGIGALDVIALGLLSSRVVLAHHMEDGKMPETFGSAFLSGLGHPVIGMDHLVAVLLVGFVSFVVTRRLLDPALFAVSSLLGCLIHVTYGAFPGVELAVAVTLPVLLALSWFSQKFAAHSRKIMAVGGLMHGFAYGEAILGVGNTQVLAYLIGLALVQSILYYIL